MNHSKWAEACLLCGTLKSTTQLPNNDQVKLTEAFCELYEIDTQLDEVWNTVQFAFYCPNCRGELLFINEFQTQRQSGSQVRGQENNASIGKSRSLESVQHQQEVKLRKFIDTLIPSGSGDQEDDTDHDLIWEEIMKRKQLLICMEILSDLRSVPSSEPEPESESEPEKDNPVPNETESLPSPSHAPLNLNPRPPSAPISTQERKYLNKNDQDTDGTPTHSVVSDAEAVNPLNSAQNSDPDSIWEDIPDEGQDGIYPADHDDHISNSEKELDADVDVNVDFDVKPEIQQDFDSVAEAGMQIIAVESLNNKINFDKAHFRLHQKSTTAADTVKEKNVLKEWRRRFNLKEFSINITRVHFPIKEEGSETGSVIRPELNPNPNEVQNLYSTLCKSVVNRKRKLGESASSKSTSKSISKSMTKSKSKSPLVKSAVLQNNCDSNSDARTSVGVGVIARCRGRRAKYYKLTEEAEKIYAIPMAIIEEVKAVESSVANAGLALPCTWTDCNKKFKTKKERVEHIRRIHEGFTYPFPCETCGQSTHSYNRYLDHQNYHLGLTPYKCLLPGCPKSFYTYDQRRDHLRKAKHNIKLGTEQNQKHSKNTRKSARSHELSPEIPQNFSELKRLHNLKGLSIHLENVNIKSEAENPMPMPMPMPTPTKEKEQRTRSGRLVKKPLKAQKVIAVADEKPIESDKTVGDGDELFDGDESESFGDYHSNNSAANSNLASDSDGSDPEIMEIKMDILRSKIRRRKQFNSEKRTKDSFKIKFDHQYHHHPNPKPKPKPQSKLKSERSPRPPRPRKNVCDTCSRVFPSARILADHVNTHNNLTPYHCPEQDCPYKTAMERNLVLHLRVHQSPRFRCEEADCGKYFKDRKCYRDHMASHKTEADAGTTKEEEGTPRVKVPRPVTVTDYRCRTCGRYYVSQIQLNRHHRNMHVYRARRKESKDFKCDQCSKTFTVQATYTRHVLTHDKEYVRQNLTCHICEKVFANRETFDHHEQEFHPEKCIFKCEHVNCKFSASRATKLRKHVALVHLSLNPRTPRGPANGPRQTQFKCPMDNCRFVSRTAGSLKGHLVHRHTDATPFECKFCTRNFKTLDYLKTHIRIVHSATKNYVCSECGKAFSHKRYLADHEETHKEVKSIMCDLCGLGFSARGGLIKHKRRHHPDPDPDQGAGNNNDNDSNAKAAVVQYSETPRNIQRRKKESYPCKFCKLIFPKERALALHKRREHADKYKFQCKQCTFGSPRLIPLQKHIQEKHTVGRPFKCDICASDFNNPKYLIRHKELVHPPEFKFSCSTCGKRFPNKRYLLDHQMFKHCHKNSATSTDRCPSLKPEENKSTQKMVKNQEESPLLDDEETVFETIENSTGIETMEVDDNNFETCEVTVSPEETPPPASAPPGILNPPQNIFNDPDPEPEGFINFGFQYNYV